MVVPFARVVDLSGSAGHMPWAMAAAESITTPPSPCCPNSSETFVELRKKYFSTHAAISDKLHQSFVEQVISKLRNVNGRVSLSVETGKRLAELKGLIFAQWCDG